MLSSSSSDPDYQNKIDGTWGNFSTNDGRVAFLMTKARLGGSATDNERRLTSKLRPVREILNVEQLNFNQLLQRDLDDHRVATELIPYVLKKQETGPAYFPPIVAVLLPFDGKTPVNEQPHPVPEGVVTEHDVTYEVQRYGELFQTQRACYPDGEMHDVKLGRLKWNEEKCKLVVIDGQHRAMALLAIDRTLNGTWDEGGEKYKYFYEHRVRRILDGNQLDLEKLEFPVNICWFPDNAVSPHTVARKLFVDLNREARQPSEARLILLSDQELQNIFSRAVLNRLREDDCPVPIYAVEYDNPSESSYRPTRWSVLTNLHFMKYAVQYGLCCPDRYLQDMTARFGGRLPAREMDDRLRDQLDVTNMMSEMTPEGDRMIRRSEVGNLYFPRQHLGDLESNFMEGWGRAIIALFSTVAPYKAHWEALNELRGSWAAEGSIASLAHEALFSGMGMYWTLRDSEEHWRSKKRDLRNAGQEVPEQPDIVGAWSALDSKQEVFERIRSKKYLQSESKEAIAESNAAFDVLNTHACQIGAVLTFAALAEEAGAKGEEVYELSEDVCNAWSRAFQSNARQTRTRKAIFAKNDDVISKPVNRVAKMDTPIAVYFRYFWLELLCLDDVIDSITDKLEPATFLRLRDRARINYFEYLIKEQQKAVKRANSDMDDREAWQQAEKQEKDIFSKSLSFWYDIDGEAFEGWYNSEWNEYSSG